VNDAALNRTPRGARVRQATRPWCGIPWIEKIQDPSRTLPDDGYRSLRVAWKRRTPGATHINGRTGRASTSLATTVGVGLRPNMEWLPSPHRAASYGKRIEHKTRC